MTLTAVFLIAGAYLFGAVPSAYLVARYIKGIDIRQYGSGNMGATNVMAFVGNRTGFLLGSYDCLAKGTLPVVLANLLDQSIGVQIGAGLAGVLGHAWSPYMRFTGGRGIATFTGVLFGFGMFYEVMILVFVLGVFGRVIFHEAGLWTFLCLLALPLLAFLLGRDIALVYMGIAAFPILMLKRLTANWEPPMEGRSKIRVAFNRILWDRDVSRREEWTERRPPWENEGLSTDAGDDALR